MQPKRFWIVIAALLLMLPIAGYFSQQVFADQPQMEAALVALKNSLEHLEKATDDKGGHRKKAIGHIRKAIVEVEKGIAFDRRH
jgi:hypothetical protein